MSHVTCTVAESCVVRNVSPRHERAVVHQFVEPFGIQCLQEFANTVTPDLDPIFQRARLPDARQNDDRPTRLTEQEVLVLREKHHLIILKSSRMRASEAPRHRA